jgi:adenylate cyclase class IV
VIEVELKFEIPQRSRAQLSVWLDGLPAVQRLADVTNIDTYYDTTNFDCLQQAVFVRIRNRACLEIKYHEYADPTHMHSTERVFPLQSEPLHVSEMNRLCSHFIPAWRPASDVEEALRVNNLTRFVRIENRRTSYIYENITLCVDHVEGLGDFFEIETQCEQGAEISQARATLQTLISGLTFPDLCPVRIGYVELWLRSHLPQVYRLGKYQEENHLGQSYAL